MDNSTTITSQQVSRPKLPGSFELLSQALKIYQQRKLTIWGIMIIPILISFAVSIFASTIIIMMDALREDIFSFDWTEILLFIFMFLGPTILISVWSYIALVYAIKDEQEKIGTIEAYSRSAGKIISYLWIAILTGVAIFIGFILFVIPGIIFAIWFNLAPYVLIVEDLRGRKALSKSREYVRGYWWSVFGRLLFLIAFFSILIVIISFVSIFLKTFGNLIMMAIIYLFFIPLITVYVFLIYSHLKSLKG